MYGTALPRGDYEQMHDVQRSVVGEITKSHAGNVVLRVGRQNAEDGSWSLTEHVVLTPAEARQLGEAIWNAST